MRTSRYQQQSLTNAAHAAGSAFGVQGEETATASHPAVAVRAIVAIAAGLCILAILAFHFAR